MCIYGGVGANVLTMNLLVKEELIDKNIRPLKIEITEVNDWIDRKSKYFFQLKNRFSTMWEICLLCVTIIKCPPP